MHMNRFFSEKLNELKSVRGGGSRKIPTAVTVILFGIGMSLGCRQDVPARVRHLYSLGREGTPAAKEKIRGALGDSDRDVRATALAVMADVDSAAAQTMAVESLGDADGVVRAAAVRALGPQLEAPLAERLAVMGLSDPVWQVRCEVLKAVATFPGESVQKAIVGGLSDQAPLVRRAALTAGLARPGLLPIETLAEILAEDGDWENRVAAAEALGISKDPAAYAPLEAASSDGHEFVRAAAIRGRETLERSGTPAPPPPPEPGAPPASPGV